MTTSRDFLRWSISFIPSNPTWKITLYLLLRYCDYLSPSFFYRSNFPIGLYLFITFIIFFSLSLFVWFLNWLIALFFSLLTDHLIRFSLPRAVRSRMNSLWSFDFFYSSPQLFYIFVKGSEYKNWTLTLDGNR